MSEMNAPEELQKLVDQAREELPALDSQESRLEKRKHVYWPKIKYTIGQYKSLRLEDRPKLAQLIFERLENLDSHPKEESAKIDVAEMVRQIQAGQGPESPKPEKIMWLPY